MRAGTDARVPRSASWIKSVAGVLSASEIVTALWEPESALNSACNKHPSGGAQPHACKHREHQAASYSADGRQGRQALLPLPQTSTIIYGSHGLG